MTADRYALIAANPFPGLRSFKPGEADRFFGRGQQINELVARLAEVPLVAVSGASGCGKSSLVLAGLLNELKRRHETDFDTDWRPVVMRPGNRPIAHLAAPLAAVLLAADAAAGLAAAPVAPGADDAPRTDDDSPLAQRTASLVGQLRLGGLGLVEAVRQSRLPAGARVLVVVDQFEEIFRFKRMADPEEASAFVKLLLQAAADPSSPVSVVLTLRSDTLGACADFRDLPEAVSRGGYLVPRLKREQRKEAIVKPVELRGARIAPRLVQRLLNDVSDDFDDLPVMQHALARTWQRWAEACAGARPIDLEDYEAVGGAANALSNHADEACSSLGALGQPGGMVERIFRALTERVAEGTEVRRPLEFEQLCAICGGAGNPQALADVTQVVERYRRADTAFLVPGAEVPLAANPVVDISHESLIRQWRQLRGWVAAEAEAAAELQRLVDDAQAHATADGELWRGRSLERARDWQQRNRPNAAWVRLCTGGSVADGEARFAAVQAFIDKSAAAEQREQRRARLQRWGLRGLVAAVIVVSVGAAFNGLSLQRQARSRELAARALLEQAQDPARSAQLALIALDQDRDNPRAEYALRQAMATLEVAQPELVLPFDAPLTEARYSADRKRLLVAGANRLWLLDAATLQTQATLTAPAAVVKAWLVGSGAAEQVVVLTDQWKLAVLAAGGSAANGNGGNGPAKPLAELACSGDRNPANTAALAPAGAAGPAQVALSCFNGELLVASLGAQGLDAPRRLLPGSEQAATITALAFSGDGRWLASGDNAGKALVWARPADAAAPYRAAIGQPAGLSPLHHDGAIRDIAFHPADASLLATASDDLLARVWMLDLAGGRLQPATAGQKSQHDLHHDRPVLRARFVQRVDDDYRLMTVSDKRVSFWTDERTRDDRRHDDWVTDANVSDNGELLVSASGDGTARVWSSRTHQAIAVLRGHRNEVTRAFFGPDGRIITTSRDGTLRRWRLQPPLLLAADSERWQLSAAISPQGDRAVVCGEKTAAGHNCRITPLADLGQRKALDAELLGDATADTIANVGWSADGQWVLGQNISHDVYQSARPALWQAASRKTATPDWLLAWQSAAFNPGRPELVTGNDAGQLAIWPQAALAEGSPKPAWTVKAPVPVQQPALSGDGRWLAAIDGASVLLWDRRAAAGAPPRRLAGHAGDINSIAFSRDSRALVSASRDRSARIWPLAAAAGAAPVLLQGGHSAALSAADFSPDGRLVLTSSADNSVRVWDAATGRELSALLRHGDSVNAVAFHPDGERILSASDDGTAQLGRCQACRLPLDALREAARQVPLAPGELDTLQAGSRVALHPFMRPAWLGGGR